MMNILLMVSYDGTNYHGWQRQNGQITVQECLENALSQLYKEEITVRGSSRTDTGVHCKGQGALYKTDRNIPVDRLPYAVNAFLPDDIVINGAYEVDDDFHPQYSVIDKTYEYKILNAEFRDPMLINYTEFIRYKLDVDKMKAACPYFCGEHDFKAFCASGSDAKTTVRTVYELNVEKKGDIISIRIRGNGFLYNMVRIIAGTLAYVGLGKIQPEDVPHIISGLDRTKAGKTLSPNGLTLLEVNYEKIDR